MNKKPVIAILADFPLFLVHADYPRRGWYYAVWLETLYEAFQRDGRYEVHWIVFCRSARHRYVFSAGGQTFHVLPTIPGNISQLLHYCTDCWVAHHELRRIAPDIIHAWGTETRHAVVAGAYRGACRKLLSMQGIIAALLARAPMPAYYRRQLPFEQRAMAQFDVVSVESEWGRDRCLEIVPEAKIELWEYAVNRAFFSVERRLSARPTCLVAGADIPLKNVETAIAAFRSPALAHVDLLVAGVEGGRYADLPPNIHLLGGVDHSRIRDLLGEVWCLLHPSLADTSPNIVKEARVAGVPVIVSSDCGGTQYVEHEKSGYIVEPRDTAGIIRSVLVLTQNEAVNLSMGACEQETCRRALCEETMVRGLWRLYAGLLGESSRKGVDEVAQ